MTKWAFPGYPLYYVQDLGRPVPNFAMSMAKPEWAILLFADFRAATDYAIEGKLGRPESLRIEGREALREILTNVRGRCPRIIKAEFRQSGIKNHRVRIQDLLKELSPKGKD